MLDGRERLAAAQAAAVDVDGTLVDSNYHHTLAWSRAFARHHVQVPLWRIHRSIGMGGDQLVKALAGDEIERRLGDDLRTLVDELFEQLIGEVAPLPGARALLEALHRSGLRVVLASSAENDEVEHYLELLAAKEFVDGWTTAADVAATKPAPDLVVAALDKAGTRSAFMIGDSTWDCLAAGRAGIPTVALLSGGYSREELLAAGALAVFESPEALVAGLDTLGLGPAVGLPTAPEAPQIAHARIVSHPRSRRDCLLVTTVDGEHVAFGFEVASDAPGIVLVDPRLWLEAAKDASPEDSDLGFEAVQQSRPDEWLQTLVAHPVAADWLAGIKRDHPVQYGHWFEQEDYEEGGGG